MKSGGPAGEEGGGEREKGAGLCSSRTVPRPSPLVKLSLVKLSLAPQARGTRWCVSAVSLVVSLFIVSSSGRAL